MTSNLITTSFPAASSPAGSAIVPLSSHYPEGYDTVGRPDVAKVREALKARNSDHMTALHVLYNLVRGQNPRMGFLPHRPKRAGRPNLNTAFSYAARMASRVAQALGVAWHDHYTTVLADARRHASLEDFAESCRVGIPSVPSALSDATRLTPHGPNSNALDHGRDCWKRYYEIVSALRYNRAHASAQDWPLWLKEHGQTLLGLQQQSFDMRLYLEYHDCGKAATLQRDRKGRLQYPGHAKASADLWRLGHGQDSVVAELMELDMTLHTATVEEMAEFSKHPLAPSLLVATYAQLLSNAESIFGGLESKSFQTKLAALNARARALIAHWGLVAKA